MKTLKPLSIALASLLLSSACGGPESSPVEHSLATFEIGTHTIEFIDDGEGGIIITEAQPTGPDEHFIVPYREGETPLDWFIALAPEDTPIPAALVTFHESEGGAALDLSQREIQEQDEEPVVVGMQDSLPQMPTTPTSPGIGSTVSAINAAATGSCGSNGGSHFRNRYCGRSGNGQIERCQATYNGGNTWWYSTNANSGQSKRKNTLTITAACGVAVASFQQYQNLVGNYWNTATSLNIGVNRIVSRAHFGLIKRHRRVLTSRQHSHHGFRTVSAFSNMIMLEQP